MTLIIKDPTKIIEGIQEIVGFTNQQYPNSSQVAERQSAIDRRIYRLVKWALIRTDGWIDLNRAHEKYYHAIVRAFKNHPDEVRIFACYHMEHCPERDNRSEYMEPFWIETIDRNIADLRPRTCETTLSKERPV